MEELFAVISEYGIPIGVIIWVLIGIQSMIRTSLPEVLSMRKIWASRSLEIQADQQEHSQTRELKEADTDRLMALIAAGSNTFKEEQLTQTLSEIFAEFQQVNEFVRRQVSKRLDDLTDPALWRIISQVEGSVFELRDLAKANRDAILALSEVIRESNSRLAVIEIFCKRAMADSPEDEATY